MIPGKRAPINLYVVVSQREPEFPPDAKELRPRDAFRRGLLAHAGQGVVEPCRPPPGVQERKHTTAEPRAIVPLVGVGRILVRVNASRRKPCREFGAREWKERSNQTTAATRRNPRETRWPGAAKHPIQNGLVLVVGVMRGHQVPRAHLTLDIAQRFIAPAPSSGLRRGRTQRQGSYAKRNAIADGSLTDTVGHGVASRRDPMVNVADGHGESQLRAGRGAGEQVEEG
jgi:hypothetical protein